MTISELTLNPAKVSEVARHHALSPQQLFGWRRLLRRAPETLPPAPDSTQPFFLVSEADGVIDHFHVARDKRPDRGGYRAKARTIGDKIRVCTVSFFGVQHGGEVFDLHPLQLCNPPLLRGDRRDHTNRRRSLRTTSAARVTRLSEMPEAIEPRVCIEHGAMVNFLHMSASFGTNWGTPPPNDQSMSAFPTKEIMMSDGAIPQAVSSSSHSRL